MVETGFIIIKDQNIFPRMNHFLHDQILRSPIELIFGANNGLKKSQILHMSAMIFDAMNKMLNYFLIHFIAQIGIAFKNGTHGLSFQKLKKKHIKVCS